MKQILESKCLDVYRLDDGVLFKAYKCNFVSYLCSSLNKRKHEKVADNVYITKEQILIRDIGGDRIVPIGSHIVEYYWVEPIDDCSKFRFELKTTGSCFSGDVNKINKYISDMNAIIEKYKK